LGSGICVARGANTYSIIFDADKWKVANADEIEADHRTVNGVQVGFVVQSGSTALSAVISEAQRVFSPKGEATWMVKNPPVVLTPAEFAAKAA
jgi:ubiquinone/menaquinone biosynthesis C-methylase UbiE